jgi:hypothetical protein
LKKKPTNLKRKKKGGGTNSERYYIYNRHIQNQYKWQILKGIAVCNLIEKLDYKANK